MKNRLKFLVLTAIGLEFVVVSRAPATEEEIRSCFGPSDSQTWEKKRFYLRDDQFNTTDFGVTVAVQELIFDPKRGVCEVHKRANSKLLSVNSVASSQCEPFAIAQRIAKAKKGSCAARTFFLPVDPDSKVNLHQRVLTNACLCFEVKAEGKHAGTLAHGVLMHIEEKFCTLDEWVRIVEN